MRSQGIKGPSYKFLHGNTKEIYAMRAQSMGRPMDHLSHEILPRILPHIHSWVNIYGRNFLNWYGAEAQLVETGFRNEGDKWTKLRKLANGVFHGESLKSMIPAMISSTEQCSKGGKQDDDKESEKLEQGIRNCIVEIIKKRDQETSNNDSKKDFLGELLEASRDNNEENRISLNDMVDECKTFYFAGHETTTSLLGWTVLLLAVHSDWQEKARAEVFELCGETNPTPDSITRLKTMNMIVEESLRLYSPVPAMKRKVKKEVRLGEMTLPSNMELYISPLVVHHDPRIWGADVHRFKPERFEEGIAKATNNTLAAFLPFGFGPRTCVGLNFAIVEAKIALAMILQRFKFELSPNYVHSPIQLFMVRPQHGVQIILESL
ncbi:hypothetical protein OSB04_009169 [Centaurea solstitialis]|uniref:Cytochrome P450 n=1 Tax=Centaurea solstitialis TaxID=347529 RepID=A0AA38TPX9_9ASTR|nr:hypothetical protein OSB04_009169 [Centaurea solstitialis]